MLAQERVVRATRDRVGVERGLAAPARERTDRALAAQLREDQLAVDSLEGREVAILDRLEAGEPLVIESIALAKAVALKSPRRWSCSWMPAIVAATGSSA